MMKLHPSHNVDLINDDGLFYFYEGLAGVNTVK